MKRGFRQSGFTLIEMLVVIAIIAIIVAISFPALSNARNREKNLEQATTILKDAILSAQNYAFAPPQAGRNYYYIAIDMTNNQFSIYPDAGGPPLQHNVSLYGKVTLSSVPAAMAMAVAPDYSNGLIIAFRVSDGRVGVNDATGNICFSDDPCWSGITFPSGHPDSIDISVNDSTGTKDILIQNITGAVSIE